MIQRNVIYLLEVYQTQLFYFSPRKGYIVYKKYGIAAEKCIYLLFGKFSFGREKTESNFDESMLDGKG